MRKKCARFRPKKPGRRNIIKSQTAGAMLFAYNLCRYSYNDKPCGGLFCTVRNGTACGRAVSSYEGAFCVGNRRFIFPLRNFSPGAVGAFVKPPCGFRRNGADMFRKKKVRGIFSAFSNILSLRLCLFRLYASAWNFGAAERVSA